MELAERICQECTKHFIAPVWKIRQGRAKFCCRECSNIGMRLKPDDFWAKIKKGSGCWEWQGCRDRNGYGVTRFNGRQAHASRLAWILTHGDPGKLFVCHKCDNPPCCRPEHLFLGTARDNAHDSVMKGRSTRGIVNGNGKLTEAAILRIRAIWGTGLLSQNEIGKIFKVSSAQICNIVSRRHWKYL